MCRCLLIAMLLTLPLACGDGVWGVPGTGDQGQDERGTESQWGPLEPSPPFYGDPAHNAVFGVDISHWEGPISQSTMDCFWDSGVRHVISGTQVEEVTRQQLTMAVRRGMTVDAYVYLYWTSDMAGQVKEAFRRAKGFPIQRMWLDVEEESDLPGTSALIAKVQQALDACQAQGTAQCGIYTGPGFWKTYMGNTDAFAHVPLWYAWYNENKTLQHWPEEHFGGWAAPTGKQWAEEALCSSGVDKDTIQVPAPPTIKVDHKVVPNTTTLPGAPKNLWPKEMVVTVNYALLMADKVPGATRYELALEMWYASKKAFAPYYTWTLYEPFYKVSPAVSNNIYRFRVRAKNAKGWGAWSAWAMFDYHDYDGPRPGPAASEPPASEPPASEPPASEPPASEPPAPPAPPAAGVPGNLAPNGGLQGGPDVALTCDAISGATQYEFEIDFLSSSGSYTHYFTYQRTTPRSVFYPKVNNTTYRWRVRAVVNGVTGDWSPYASFQF